MVEVPSDYFLWESCSPLTFLPRSMKLVASSSCFFGGRFSFSLRTFFRRERGHDATDVKRYLYRLAVVGLQ